MGDGIITSLTTVAVAVVGVAIIAVLVSKQSATPAVIQNLSEGFSSVLGAAVSPLNNTFAGSGLGHNYATQY